MKNIIIDIFALIGCGSVLSSLLFGFHILRVYLTDYGSEGAERSGTTS